MDRKSVLWIKINSRLSTIYHGYIIPRQQKDYRTYLQASDELFFTELNFYPQNRIFIHTNLFLSTKSYKITTWWQFIVCVPFPDDRESRIMHLQASCELFSTESNFYPQSSIFIHISYNSYPQDW